MLINVNEYKHLSTDSDMINAAISKARESGCAVVVPKYNERTKKAIWDITKTIVLYDDTTIYLHNSHLRMGDGAVCKMFVNENHNLSLAPENRQRNITVKGIGGAVLDGGIHNGVYEKNGIVRKVPQKTEFSATDNCMMYFKNVENLTLDGLYIKNQRYWGVAMSAVSYSHISNIRFFSESNVPNQDGVDILVGCHDMIVENISGCVGDNLVAICAISVTDSCDGLSDVSMGDIRNITVRNIMGYGVGGCALVRILNHDGYKIYNIKIDNVIETSPWSEDDAPVAQNPDLLIKTDENGQIIPWKKIVPGEIGYRTEATILIGESYWYNKTKAQPGDTFGISVSNVMSHARFAVWINNTLQDSCFDNIRLFGNGYMAAYFGEGTVGNVRFSGITYDKDCKMHKEDRDIFIEWNNTRAKGLSCIYFNGTCVKDVSFENVAVSGPFETFAGGFGTGEVTVAKTDAKGLLSDVTGIKVNFI